MKTSGLQDKEALEKKRRFNTTVDNKSFSEDVVERVWNKGEIIHGRSPDAFRLDVCGAIMDREEFGNKYSLYGWEVDHVKPVALGGTDDEDNLQPLRWQNNRYKGDNYPSWTCKIPAVKTITQ